MRRRAGETGEMPSDVGREMRGMDDDEKSQPPDVAQKTARRVGRPRIIETAGASLTTILNLVRSGIASTRLDIKHTAELGRAVVTDRLATLESLGLLAEGELGVAIGGRAPRHVRFCEDA